MFKNTSLTFNFEQLENILDFRIFLWKICLFAQCILVVEHKYTCSHSIKFNFSHYSELIIIKQYYYNFVTFCSHIIKSKIRLILTMIYRATKSLGGVEVHKEQIFLSEIKFEDG